MRILLVEDDFSLRTALEEGLRLEGLEVAGAGTVEEAHVLLSRERFDIILTDLRLPRNHYGGYAVLERVNATQPSAPVILFTGNEEPNGEARARALGARAYLTKPVTLRTLRRAIEQALPGQG